MELPKTPPPPQWSDLFNGKDLTGWRVADGGLGNWKVSDGALTCAGEQSYLYSLRDDFGDFHLKLEAKINETGNGGVFFHAARKPGIPEGLEAQINITGDMYHTGSLHGLKQTTGPAVKSDVWFPMEIIAEGERISILVDGKPAVTNYVVEGGKRKPGHIALQHYSPGTKVFYRKIQMKE